MGHQCQQEPLEVHSGSTEALGSTRKTVKKSGISNLAAVIQASISARKKVVLVPPLYPEPKSRIMPPALAAAAVSRKKVCSSSLWNSVKQQPVKLVSRRA